MQADAPGQQILNLLKRSGPLSVAELAGRLGVTASAVRQQLSGLAGRNLVARELCRGRIGRPRALWRTTAAADRHFPDRHAHLAAGLIAAIEDRLGDDALRGLLQAATAADLPAQRARMPGAASSLRRRVAALRDLRQEQGYMAEIGADRDGAVLLIENHCPLSAIAASCPDLCDCELEAFSELLGRDAAIERIEHMARGDRRCAYRVTPIQV
jgi:predicted ArsR family transcriptional regulator